ncbi:phosphoribosylanthranilate isomerase [uncultured Marivita sp.]|uniref:phosphoribosylanthranilate isomerase n=1 Tax=uncultured Marivita sp. TaxID=888080 RepID=UPI002604AE66|nr:phosphoribosylanthranilate isomerase [uncultured Marivita sp.]
MPSDIRVKICGLTRPEDVTACATAGAAYIGLNFFPKSPRFVSFETARDLAVDVPIGVGKVGLVVNADDAFLDELIAKVPLDFIQLHGSEPPERVADVRERYGLPVIKAVGVADAEDVAALDTFADVADQLLVDAKPPKNAVMPGGNGVAFDWRLISARRWSVPWLLAGGLTPDNVAEAIALTGTRQVDVSSGVESAPGIKDAGLIRRFVEAAR